MNDNEFFTKPAEKSAKVQIPRVYALDALRGLMILLMVGHHLLYDLAYLFGMPEWIVRNPVIEVASTLGAGLFIAMSGATASVSRSNLRHGLRILLAAAAVTVATAIFDRESVIVFGILQFLGVSALLYAAIAPFWKKIPRPIMPAVCGAVLALSLILRSLISGGVWYTIPLGFCPTGFQTLDYFPLLPWFSVYLFGIWLGAVIFGRRLPAGFYRWRNRFLEKCGKWSIWIYLLHQPAMLLVLTVVFDVLK